MSSQETKVSFEEVFQRDQARNMLGELTEPFSLCSVDGLAKIVRGRLSGGSELAVAEPGYADTNTLNTTDAEYPLPKTGDRLVDPRKVEWIVEPGARCVHGLWSVPVKSDRRLRS